MIEIIQKPAPSKFPFKKSGTEYVAAGSTKTINIKTLTTDVYSLVVVARPKYVSASYGTEPVVQNAKTPADDNQLCAYISIKYDDINAKLIYTLSIENHTAMGQYVEYSVQEILNPVYNMVI